ncbi:MAG: GGDEF domain-containing protein [Gammaproteobacteria bacterium]|jgi:diguanylate cyclase (GGDEF)-like protein|nr:GGDEF domain-containing protein [Gammaproteobacteria bacterium]
MRAKERIDWDQFDDPSRIVGQVQWLLMVLVLLYLALSRDLLHTRPELVLVLVTYTITVLILQYAHWPTRMRHWKAVLHSWVMILFLSLVLAGTGGIDTGLNNLFLLVIVTSALTLGLRTTLLQVGLIAAIQLYLLSAKDGIGALRPLDYALFLADLAPWFLVAFLITTVVRSFWVARRQVQSMAETDELTGLLNMRGLYPRADAELAQCMASIDQLSVLMVDADDLKLVNDRLGHEAGDILIRHIATRLRRSLRHTDLVARYGGDEFVAVLPGTGRVNADSAALKVEEAIQGDPLTARGETILPSVSIGISTYPADGLRIDDLIERADEAMYEVKLQRKVAAEEAG